MLVSVTSQIRDIARYRTRDRIEVRVLRQVRRRVKDPVRSRVPVGGPVWRRVREFC